VDIADLKQIAKDIRKISLQMAHDAPSSHIGSALSCVDILVSLFFEVMDEEDRFILSKGHGCISYYATLVEAGFFPEEWLKTYSKNGSLLPEHPPSHGVPGIDFGTGSLGHGLSLSVGAALARKMAGVSGTEFVLLGDGECNEGSVWEAAMFASKMKLNNLVAIVDRNNMQANGFNDECDLAQKFESFGWDYFNDHNGNKISELVKTFKWAKSAQESPVAIIAHTTKGKGVSFMEDNLLWHYRPPNDRELELALKEIENA